MLADSAITVDVEKPALVVEEETTPDTAAESEFRVPDAEDAWAAVRHALFLPGTAVPTLPSLLSYFSDSAEIVFVATGNVVKGRAAIMELFKQTAAAGYTYDGTQNEIVSQMAGRDRVSGQRMMIETLILALVHDQPIGWLLPDVKPTKKRLLVPVVGLSSGGLGLP